MSSTVAAPQLGGWLVSPYLLRFGGILRESKDRGRHRDAWHYIALWSIKVEYTHIFPIKTSIHSET
jgi:hypothetical protein